MASYYYRRDLFAKMGETMTVANLPIDNTELDFDKDRVYSQNGRICKILSRTGVRTELLVISELKNIDNLDLSVTFFGAIGNGTADDTTAFKTAIQYARTKRLPLIVPAGTYLISETLDFRGLDLNFLGTIRVTHHGVGIIVGDNSTKAYRRNINISNVTHQSYDDGDISVRIMGTMNANVNIDNATFIDLYADGSIEEDSAIAYSSFHFGFCQYLKISDNADATEIGWINENVFYNCRVLNNVWLIGNTYTHNNNVFYKPCFEGASVELKNCSRNKFYDLRNEGYTDRPFSLILDENTSFNLIEYNFFYYFPFGTEKLGFVDNGVGNIITNSVVENLMGVPLYTLNAPVVRNQSYIIGSAKTGLTVNEDDSITISDAWLEILPASIIPIDGIKYFRGSVDKKSVRFLFTPLNENKEIISNNDVLIIDGGGEQNANGEYGQGANNIKCDVLINNNDVKYVKIRILMGQAGPDESPEQTFNSLNLTAYCTKESYAKNVHLEEILKTRSWETE